VSFFGGKNYFLIFKELPKISKWF